jgi:hypothetical protein
VKNHKKPDSPAVSERTTSGRRDFLRKSGAAVSAALVPAAPAAFALTEESASGQVGPPEDIAAVRKLYQDYAGCVAERAFEHLRSLFTKDGEILFNGRRTAVRERGFGYLQGSASGARPEQSGQEAAQLRLLQDPAEPPDRIVIADDRQSARAAFRCVARIAAPLVGNAPLVEMARLQGQHAETWWEGGSHELDCVKVGDSWKIRRLAYSTSVGGRPNAASSNAASCGQSKQTGKQTGDTPPQ